MTMKPAVAAIGGVVASVVVALGIAAFVLDDDGADRGAGDRDAATGTAPPTTAEVDRGGDVIVFLQREVTDAQRQSIEALLDTQPEIASYEYWNQERSTAEARDPPRGQRDVGQDRPGRLGPDLLPPQALHMRPGHLLPDRQRRRDLAGRV